MKFGFLLLLLILCSNANANEHINWNKTGHVTVEMTVSVPLLNKNGSSWDPISKDDPKGLPELLVIIDSGDNGNIQQSASTETFEFKSSKCKNTTLCTFMIDIYSEDFNVEFFNENDDKSELMHTLNHCSLKHEQCENNGFAITNIKIRRLTFK